MKKPGKLLLLLMVLVFAFSMNASAAKKVKWVLKDGAYYATDSKTGRLLKNTAIGKYYVDKNGKIVTNEFRKGRYYNYRGRRTKFKGGFIKVNGKYYYFYKQKKLTGFRKIGKHYYLFDKTGASVSGLQYVRGGYRMFLSTGRMVTKKWVTWNNKKYYIGKNGIMKIPASEVQKQEAASAPAGTGIPANPGLYSDLLFFTNYESGMQSYSQAGGDKGRAYGRYQFDYRYALVPFLKFCYDQNPDLCPEFRVFTFLQPGDKRLISGNSLPVTEAGLSEEEEMTQDWDLKNAWNAVCSRSAGVFASWQDLFAIANYYSPVEKALAGKGIHLNARTYIERGAVYSYSIQSGPATAVNAVIAAGITDTTSSRDFLNALYDYRWNDAKAWNRNALFLYRYGAEKTQALAILAALGG